MLPTIEQLAAELAAGRSTSRTLVEAALARIEDPAGEGKRVFLKVDREAAVAAAEASDRLRKFGVVPSPLAGLPVSIKDLFDIAGQVTTAGSKILRDEPPAKADAPTVARLRAAGAILVGRTNMTEFAYSGVGINPHYGTPGSPADRSRVPGGSSSGAGVSVADQMAVVGLGTDTGGSVRIPSAFSGVTGFKPTQYRVSRDGAVPLSFTLDSIGPLAPSVSCCAIVDAILAGDPVEPLPAIPVEGLRFAVPQNFVLENMDDQVGAAFARALSNLSRAGAKLTDIQFPELDEQAAVNAGGGFSAPEAMYWHKPLIARDPGAYDQRVLTRIRRAAQMSAADYVEVQQRRVDIIARAARRTAPFDAVLMPTVAIVPPKIADLEHDDQAFGRANPLILRNTALGNFLDRCAASLPCHRPGELPVGLMLMGEHGGDRRLLTVAAAVEKVLQA